MMNPLQEKANQLRAALQEQAATEKGHQQQHRQIVGVQVREQFSSDFPQLFELLIQSHIQVSGEATQQGQQVILTSTDRELTVYCHQAKNDYTLWRFHGKDYEATSKESEQRLIIAIADAFSLAQSKRMAGK